MCWSIQLHFANKNGSGKRKNEKSRYLLAGSDDGLKYALDEEEMTISRPLSFDPSAEETLF